LGSDVRDDDFRMTRFLLMRHSHHDAIGRYLAGAAPGLHLNDAGRGQLGAIVRALHDERIDAVVSSPLERTRETAEPIAADHGVDVQIDDRLIEYGVGEWTGRPFASLDATIEWRRFNAVRSLSRAPGGELMLAVQQRALAALLEWRDRYPAGKVVVVSHGDVIRAVLLYLLGMPPDFLHRVEISPGRITVFELGEDGVQVLQVNGDTAPPAL
jgi:broad specificity phosphatase PhoE